jgi:hypothetical protein
MTRERRRALSAGCAWGVALLLGGTSARAHGGAGDDAERSVPEASAAPAPTGGSTAPEAEGRRPEREPKAMVALDMVLGWGRVPFALQNLPQAGQPSVTYTRSDGVSSNVQSIIMAGSMDVVEHVGVGARLPLTFAGFSPNGTAGRSTTSFGNLELEGEYSQHVAPRLRLIGSLGLALPTAQGTELPDLNQTPAQQVDTTSYDRYSLNRAAAAARGFEDNALFEPNRLGIVPKVALAYSLHGVSIEPYVKVENLIGTSTALAAPYVGEVVAAARVGYWVQHLFELSFKGLVNIGFAGTDDDKKVAVALEPDVVLRFGPVRPYAGVIVPVAGPPSENGFVGVHFGVALAL